MKPSGILCVLIAVLGGAACSLVTVPVKVAGGIVETTVVTTGKVIAAPFKAMGGNDREDSRTSGDQPKAQSEPKPAPAAGEEKEAADE